MFKEIKDSTPPFVIRGNFTDPYLLYMVRNYLMKLFTLEEVKRENLTELRDYETNYLFSPSKPRAFLVNALAFPGEVSDIKKLTKKSVVVLENFNMDLKLGLPVIVIPRLKATKKTAAMVSDYCKYFLEIPIEVDPEVWKEIYSPSFSVFKDIQKVVLAEGAVTVQGFNAVTLTSPTSIQIVALLKNIFEGSLSDSVLSLEAAWDCGVSLESSLAWFVNRLEVFLEAYARGLTTDEALIEAEMTGNLKALLQYVSKQSAGSLASRIWSSLSGCCYYRGRSKDLMLLLSLFNLV
jgi:hypothetical protein